MTDFLLLARCQLIALFGAAMVSHAALATLAPVAADSFICAFEPNTNHGLATELDVGPVCSAVLRFDLSGLPSGITAAGVSKAVLVFWVSYADASGALQLQSLGSGWSEDTVTWNIAAMDSNLGAFATTTSIASSQNYVTVDVTDMVRSWISTPSSNSGLMISSLAPIFALDSKENVTTSHAAYLDITLASASPASLAIGTVTTGTAAAASIDGTPPNQVLNLTLPRGADGAQGPVGPIGPAGPQGLPGPAGSGSRGTMLLSHVAAGRGFSRAKYAAIVGGSTATANQVSEQYLLPIACSPTALIGKASAKLKGLTVSLTADGATTGYRCVFDNSATCQGTGSANLNPGTLLTWKLAGYSTSSDITLYLGFGCP